MKLKEKVRYCDFCNSELENLETTRDENYYCGDTCKEGHIKQLIQDTIENIEEFKPTNSSGVTHTLRIVLKGMKYGRDNCLTYDEDKPMIEFYDKDYFISRYYCETVIEHNQNSGLDLCGYMEKQYVERQHMRKITEMLQEMLNLMN